MQELRKHVWTEQLFIKKSSHVQPILTYGCTVCGTDGSYSNIETYHNKFPNRALRVNKSNKNTALLDIETERFPRSTSININMCIIKF